MTVDGAALERTGRVRLHRLRAEASSFAVAMRTWAESLEDGLAIGWSHERVELGRVRGGDVVGPDGGTLDVDAWYEGRAFNEVAELRWLRRPAGGVAVLVTEDDSRAADGWEPLADPDVDRLDGITHLLWGQAMQPSANGWVRLATARIGSHVVPVEGVAEGGSVLLRACEYVARDRDGNAVVVDERLLTIAPHPPVGRTGKGTDDG